MSSSFPNIWALARSERNLCPMAPTPKCLKVNLSAPGNKHTYTDLKIVEPKQTKIFFLGSTHCADQISSKVFYPEPQAQRQNLNMIMIQNQRVNPRLCLWQKGDLGTGCGCRNISPSSHRLHEAFGKKSLRGHFHHRVYMKEFLT